MLFRTDGCSRINRRHNERYAAHCVLEHNRFSGGSVMVWLAGIHYAGRTALMRVNEALDAQIYRDEILQQHVAPLVTASGGISQHDNAKPHTVRVCRYIFFFYNKTTFMSYHGQYIRQIYPHENTSGPTRIAEFDRGTLRHKHYRNCCWLYRMNSKASPYAPF